MIIDPHREGCLETENYCGVEMVKIPRYTYLRVNCTQECICKTCGNDNKGTCEIGNCTDAQKEGACPAIFCTKHIDR